MRWRRGAGAAFVLLAGFGFVLTLASARPVMAGDVKIAVAANFAEPARAIALAFERATGNRTTISTGSTGQLYAQIAQGAPFDVFLAADTVTPARAIAAGHAVEGSALTYALGRLVLYSRSPGLVRDETVLRLERVAKLAIANPETAPYGRAAVEVMERLGVWRALAGRLVRGQSIAQTYQFVETGSAEVGFVALAQVIDHDRGSRWVVPDSLHTPIAQGAVLLSRAASNPGARAFLAYLDGSAATAVLLRFGYARPVPRVAGE